jgi:hypothetical protein
MKIVSALAACVLIAGLATPALADRERCAAVPTDQWMAIDKAIGKAEGLGYAVTKAKRGKKGCWEIEGYDRNGAEIELKLDPASGEVVKPRDWRPPAKM